MEYFVHRSRPMSESTGAKRNMRTRMGKWFAAVLENLPMVTSSDGKDCPLSMKILGTAFVSSKSDDRLERSRILGQCEDQRRGSLQYVDIYVLGIELIILYNVFRSNGLIYQMIFVYQLFASMSV